MANMEFVQNWLLGKCYYDGNCFSLRKLSTSSTGKIIMVFLNNQPTYNMTEIPAIVSKYLVKDS